MIKVQQVIDYVQELTGHPLNKDEGVLYGIPERDVARVTVCWMATAAALEHTGKNGGGLVLAHESLYYPYDSRPEPGKEADWQKWPTNVQRLKLLERYDMPLLRVHGSLDEICVFDDFAALLGFGEPVEVAGLVKVYEIPACTVRDLVKRTKEATGLGTLRVSAPNGLDQTVHRIGLPWGGVGLFVNVGYQQKLIARNCDAFIAGESDNYGARFSAELGIPMIETDHEVSENPGLRRFAGMLAERFPETEVEFYECERVWRLL